MTRCARPGSNENILQAQGQTRENLLPLFRKRLHKAETFLELPLDKQKEEVGNNTA